MSSLAAHDMELAAPSSTAQQSSQKVRKGRVRGEPRPSLAHDEHRLARKRIRSRECRSQRDSEVDALPVSAGFISRCGWARYGRRGHCRRVRFITRWRAAHRPVRGDHRIALTLRREAAGVAALRMRREADVIAVDGSHQPAIDAGRSATGANQNGEPSGRFSSRGMAR